MSARSSGTSSAVGPGGWAGSGAASGVLSRRQLMRGSCTNASSMAITLSRFERSTRMTLSQVCLPQQGRGEHVLCSLACCKGACAEEWGIAAQGIQDQPAEQACIMHQTEAGGTPLSRVRLVAGCSNWVPWEVSRCHQIKMPLPKVTEGAAALTGNAHKQRLCQSYIGALTREHTPEVAFNAGHLKGADHHTGEAEGDPLRELLTVHAGLKAVAEVNVQQLARIPASPDSIGQGPSAGASEQLCIACSGQQAGWLAG